MTPTFAMNATSRGGTMRIFTLCRVHFGCLLVAMSCGPNFSGNWVAGEGSSLVEGCGGPTVTHTDVQGFSAQQDNAGVHVFVYFDFLLCNATFTKAQGGTLALSPGGTCELSPSSLPITQGTLEARGAGVAFLKLTAEGTIDSKQCSETFTINATPAACIHATKKCVVSADCCSNNCTASLGSSGVCL